jgi:hypothetical protein
VPQKAMSSKDNLILLYRLLELQTGAASAEDRALRGRNPSADLEPDRRQARPPSGGPAALPESEKKRKIHRPSTPDPLCCKPLEQVQNISFQTKPINIKIKDSEISVHLFG